MTKGLYQDVIDNARRYPERDAIVSDGRTLSYAELDQQADLTAAVLQELGVGPGDRVVIWADKAPSVIITVQAVLRLGAAYVPVEESSPPGRVDQIIELCQARVICVAPHRTIALPDRLTAKVSVCELADDRAGTPMRQRHPVCSSDIAVIFFTSGSTGVPKGVCISHGNLDEQIDWTFEMLALTPDDRVSSYTPLAFAFSVVEIYTTLRAGAALHLVPRSYALTPDRLVAVLRGQGLSVWLSVPSVMTLMMVNGGLFDGPAPKALRTLVFAGEAVSLERVRRLMTWAPSVDVFNVFGSTEAQGALYHKASTDDLADGRSLPVGRPFRGVRAWAAAEDGSLVAGGGVGELVIDSPAVMRGYLGQPPHSGPFFTGDLVTVSPDGTFHLVGRKNNMRKVRGNRIDLGEIEAVFHSYPGVTQAVAVIHGEGFAARLVVYVTTENGAPVAVLDVKRHVSQRLTPAAIPDCVFTVAQLPLLANGKVDRRELAARGNAPADSTTEGVR